MSYAIFSESSRAAKSCSSKLELKLGISHHSYLRVEGQLVHDVASPAAAWDLQEQLVLEWSILFILYLLVRWEHQHNPGCEGLFLPFSPSPPQETEDAASKWDNLKITLLMQLWCKHFRR